jgi:hypothetical protein
MLFGQTVAVYCENHTEHTDVQISLDCLLTYWSLRFLYTTPVRTWREARRISDAKPNRLMLCGGTVAVYCENRTEHTWEAWNTSHTVGLYIRVEYSCPLCSRYGLVLLQVMSSIVMPQPQLRWLAVSFPLRLPVFDVRECGICGGQNDTKASFLWVRRLPLPIVTC